MTDIPHWPREFTTAFIELYRSHPCLWKVKDKQYTDKILKNVAYQELINLSKPIDPTANRDFVVKRIQSLRGSFRKELRKVLKSKRSGATGDDVYRPKLWYYNQLLFTRNQDTAVGSGNREDEEEHSSNEDTGIQIRLTESLATTSDTKRRVTYREEPNKTLKRLLAPTERDEGPASKAHSMSYKDVNEFDAVGISVASKLKRMDPTQAIYAEMLINKIVCRGLLSALTANTDIHEICWNPNTAPNASPTHSNSGDK